MQLETPVVNSDLSKWQVNFFRPATQKHNRLLLVQMDICVKMWNNAG